MPDIASDLYEFSKQSNLDAKQLNPRLLLDNATDKRYSWHEISKRQNKLAKVRKR